ncbi:heme biosynthesis HemY N-terminal domain-containing protein [Echinimonas agarilytica]|uniref:HemY N-terminal domain-containing protein n=1 Tax=Echinimonas agarilytica TaxID=1215918 RepID=A0AA42B613_9GAMM|nr:heme biosynthesis HemY N-terminal domain-containing protein [Echinimonas agarilytica]MCM2678250.1 hypothetical protein [Echinimonas agarilytica]
MIRIIIILVIAALAVIFGPIASGNKGYVLIAMGDLTIEMTVVSFVISMIILFIGFLLVEWTIKKVLRITNQSFLWLSHRKKTKALQQTSDGLLAVAAQDWRNAEKLLSRSAPYSHTPALNYLVAAEAAKQLGHSKRSEQYFEHVGDAAQTSLAVAMTKARLAHDADSRQSALTVLEQWRKRHPKNVALLNQVSRLYLQLEMWAEWLDILPALRKYSATPHETLDQQATQAQSQYLDHMAHHKGVESTLNYWHSLPKEVQQNPEILSQFSLTLRHHGASPQASELVYALLCKTPHQALLDEWYQLPVVEQEEKLLAVKKLRLKESSERAAFIGMTALHAKHFAEAADYLKQAIRLESHQRDHLALAHALEQSGNYSSALEVYKKAVTTPA